MARRADLVLPPTRRSRMVKLGHFMLQHEVDGPPNAVTEMDVIEVQGALARYALSPITGEHRNCGCMAALGLPILGDGLALRSRPGPDRLRQPAATAGAGVSSPTRWAASPVREPAAAGHCPRQPPRPSLNPSLQQG